MLEALIFDLDGVIVNSEPLHFEADRLTMRHYGMELSDEVLESYVGVAGWDMWADMIPRYRIPDTLESVIARQQRLKRELLQTWELTAIPGVRELLSQTARLGLKIAVASSSPKDFVEAVLDKLGIRHCFAAVASAQEVARSKPSPDVFLLAAERLSAAPSRCLVIEDAAHGVSAAKAAGMRCVGFRNPDSGQQDLSRADVVVDSMGDIDLSTLD